MKNEKKKIILIDGNYCLYQTYYALPNLYTDQGHPTGAIYGFICILEKLYSDFKPKKIIIIFDSPGKNQRHYIYSEYKKNRKKMPKNLYIQMKIIKNIILSFGIPYINKKKIEADDIIGTLQKHFSKKKNKIFIYSSDKDMFQLLDKNTYILPRNYKKNIISQEKFIKKYQILPNQLPDFIGLVGDICDNIPGIKGIGKKTAIILLKKFLSIEEIYKNLKKIPTLKIRSAQNIYKNLKKNKKNAFLSKKLSTINNNINLNLSNNKLKISLPNFKKIKKIFKKYQLNNFLKKIKKNQLKILQHD